MRRNTSEYGAGTAVVLRLVKNWFGTGQIIIGDSALHHHIELLPRMAAASINTPMSDITKPSGVSLASASMYHIIAPLSSHPYYQSLESQN